MFKSNSQRVHLLIRQPGHERKSTYNYYKTFISVFSVWWRTDNSWGFFFFINEYYSFRNPSWSPDSHGIVVVFVVKRECVLLPSEPTGIVSCTCYECKSENGKITWGGLVYTSTSYHFILFCQSGLFVLSTRGSSSFKYSFRPSIWSTELVSLWYLNNLFL